MELLKRTSAGILVVRRRGSDLEYLLCHPGGPYFVGKDDYVWSLPKGEIEHGEDMFLAALREFAEETGVMLGNREFEYLGMITQRSGKVVHCWACIDELDVGKMCSNTFEMEWPKGIGTVQCFPEVDGYAYFDKEMARRKMNVRQFEFVERAEEIFSWFTQS